jgi:tRNA dimethylallyltransferase
LSSISSAVTTPDRPLVVILGATATGKTSLAIALAQQLNGEIISADSRQIYREMDIGTAKATPQQQALIPHHLIDVVNPDEVLSAAEYRTQALQSIDDIHARGKLPFLVGGTGQYITMVTEGWSPPSVAPDEALRAELEAYAAQYGAAALYDRLVHIDAEAAQAIHPNNVRRTIRALEVYYMTGQPFSQQRGKNPPPYRLYMMGLKPDRDVLYARADARVDSMMEEGFLKEVQRLLNRGYDRNLPSMTGLGYAELTSHLLDGEPLEGAIQRTKHNTHDFIRRQEVWFRGHDRGIVWHNGEKIDTGAIQTTLHNWLKESGV